VRHHCIEFPDTGTCEMRATAEGIIIVYKLAAGRDGPRRCHFCGDFLNACASVMALEKGRCVHEQIAQSG
jgi:hypothetical protein